MKISIFSLTVAIVVWVSFLYTATYGSGLEEATRVQLFYVIFTGAGIGLLSSAFGFYNIQKKLRIGIALSGMIFNSIPFLFLGYMLIITSFL